MLGPADVSAVGMTRLQLDQGVDQHWQQHLERRCATPAGLLECC